jgi:hypothetical protein
MAISIGEHLVFGDGGHLKRNSSNGHLLRRNRILKIGDNLYAGGDGTRASVYPAIYDNRYDVTWADYSDLYAASYWSVLVGGGSSAKAYSSYAAYNTSSINGTSVSSVDLSTTLYFPNSGGGAFYVGFRTSSSATADDSYSWITGASESFAITASGAQTKNFSSSLTFDDYLFVTVWIAAYEPPTASSWIQNHYFALSTEFLFNE